MRTLAVAAISFALWFAQAWWIMVALGIAHGHDDRIPAFGYGAVLWLVSAVSAAVTLSLVYAELREAARS